MAFRDKWLNNAGGVSEHSEVFLHAIDREIPNDPIDVLLVGVGNGGDAEIWRDVLPDGSTVTGIDVNEDCVTVMPDVLVGNPSDKDWLFATFADRGFDLIIWKHAGVPDRIWPWLRSGGRLVIEDLWPPSIAALAKAVVDDSPTWLPSEEIMRVNVYPHVTVVEKRNPRVLPYIRIMTGNFAEVVSEESLISQGVKRVLVN